MSKARMMRAALRKVLGGGAGMLPRGGSKIAAEQMRSRKMRAFDAAAAAARANDDAGQVSNSVMSMKAGRAQDYLNRRATRTNNAAPVSAVRKVSVRPNETEEFLNLPNPLRRKVDVELQAAAMSGDRKRARGAVAKMLREGGLPEDRVTTALKELQL